MSIPLLDLKAQYLSIKEEIDQAVLAVLDSSKFIFGPEMKRFEEEMALYCGTKHAIAVGNGTDALVIALKACGIVPGDEVITSPFTFFASAEAIAQVGATPVFVDVDPRTLNMDAAKLAEKITPRTKGIIPVHIFGQMADMDPILALAQKHRLKVIEDAAQAIGAEYKGHKAGSLGDAGTFSFFPTKNLGGYGDGGMIVTNDDALAEEARMLRFHGCQTKYYHDEIGYNSRLDELQAAILRVKFRYIDQWNQTRAEKAAVYHQLLAPLADARKIILPFTDVDNKHVFHLYVVRTAQREKLMAALTERGVANAVYYPVPLHLQKALAYLSYQAGDFPIAEEACEQALAIPCYPELTQEQQEEIAVILLKMLG
ncbi:pleiotropic regulatory protein DegT [Desulfitobacterium hafniense DP7]|uniref:Pleiotropic regulatory protein DegT n=1 Tax=Desulfitobacterium hafniense DP7 TaxID=537010 RepID=G9XVZ2_DESHA|nr:DegT/DnrJ/EryC1/StrS family aminotransferase [Desulfitobacterium hafniense]EHL04255.1 pleiotropic regulatory protein DegT [Desulfitobacterium hafniense DP7]